jgi:hypothetical protein
MAGYTMAGYEKLCAAIASGLKKVRYDAQNEIDYQSTDEMLRAKLNMEQALGLDPAGNVLNPSGTSRMSVGVYVSGR